MAMLEVRMKKRRLVLSAILSLSLVFGLCPGLALAADPWEGGSSSSADLPAFESKVASGTWGSCPWELSADGVLTVHPGEGADARPWEDYGKSIKSVSFKAEAGKRVVLPADSSGLLANMQLLETADLSGLDTSKVTDMRSMFAVCKSLKSIDLAGFDTSQVTDMGWMFSACESLASLDLSALDTSKVTSMSFMFNDCVRLESLDLTPLDTSNVTGMNCMFYFCTSLESLDLTPLDTSKVEDMQNMFAGCRSLATLDLSPLDTSSATNMQGLFYSCDSLVSLDLTPLDTSNVTQIGSMFYLCTSLASLDLSTFDTSKVTYAESWNAPQSVFAECRSLARVEVGPKTLANLSLGVAEVNGHPDWYSEGSGAWYSSEQISAERKGVSDAYVKTSSTYKPVEVPATPVIPGATITIRFDGPFGLFIQLIIDGKVIGKDRYASRSGSTVIEIAATEENGLGAGEHEIAALYSDGAVATADVEVAAPVTSQAMYRLYNPNSGEHFYTASELERDSVAAAGWDYERVGWYAPAKSATPVYRLYNPNLPGEHHYTMDAGERDILVSFGWTWESRDYNADGAAWYSDDAKGAPLYREYNPNAYANNHNYTTDYGEHEALLALGWNDEGLAWYGVAE